MDTRFPTAHDQNTKTNDFSGEGAPVFASCMPQLHKRPVSLSQVDLQELRELIGTIWWGGDMPSHEADQIVSSANRSGSSFTSRLAIRALRLEQALVAAQERLIRLEWKLTQIIRSRRFS